MSAPVRVGLLDSGVADDLAPSVIGGRRFVLGAAGGVRAEPAVADALGHGTALARIILATAPEARLVNAQIFGTRLVTSAAVVVEGLAWLVAEGVRLVNVSFGLRDDRRVLREACAAAVDAGVVLLASAPARGLAVYPAAYPGVVRITGDARCAPGEISRLATAQADYGACARPLGDSGATPRVGGASFAVAWAAGALVAFLAGHPTADHLAARRHLDGLARYHGAERRRA